MNILFLTCKYELFPFVSYPNYNYGHLDYYNQK